MTISTKPQNGGWEIDDLVTRLRIRGTDDVRDLARSSKWMIGAAADCGIRLHDPSEKTSRHHAELALEAGVWIIRNVSTTNSTRHDGEPRTAFAVTPGIEIGFGGITLIAESPRLIALREYLARLLGWAPDRRAVVDHALSAVRHFATMRTALVVAGDGDLSPIVRTVHAHATAPTAPLVFARAGEPGMPAFEQATGGSFCLVHEKPPVDLKEILARAARLEVETRVVLCSKTIAGASDSIAALVRSASIEIPPLSHRPRELDQLFLAFAEDAVGTLAVPSNGFRDGELRWLRDIDYESLADVAETMLRVVAIRNFGVTHAASRFGIHYTALSKWAKRRRIPT